MLITLLILSLPTESTTVRTRAWRALKASGAAVLRDGVYALPAACEDSAPSLQAVAQDVTGNGGTARVLQADSGAEDLRSLFSRGSDFNALLADISTLRGMVKSEPAVALRNTRRLRKTFEHLKAIDFFPGPAQRQASSALQALEAAVAQGASPDEPRAASARTLLIHNPSDYQARVWATRARPGVDRLASAWLIRRFIDPQARFLWLTNIKRCPVKAVGFDFDGATFTHVGARVTFEVLLACFQLETPALLRLGLLVHSLDAGGVQPPEAAGLEPVLAGMRLAILDDAALFLAAAGVFESLHLSFTQAAQATKDHASPTHSAARLTNHPTQEPNS